MCGSKPSSQPAEIMSSIKPNYGKPPAAVVKPVAPFYLDVEWHS